MNRFKFWVEAISMRPEDVLAMFDWHDSFRDLYPGYSREENQYSDEYYFKSQTEAMQAVQDILHTLSSLPDPIPVYRAIYANSPQDIAPDYGESWSFDRRAALEFGSHNRSNYLLSGQIRKNDVDWKETVHRYVLNSYAHWGEAEDEIVIPYPEKILNFTATRISKR